MKLTHKLPSHLFAMANDTIEGNFHRIAIMRFIPASIEYGTNSFVLRQGAAHSKTFRFEDVRRIVPMHHATMVLDIEVQLKNGHCILLSFPERATPEPLLRALGKLRPDGLAFWTEQWVSHSLSSFHYLLILNRFVGRSFTCATQYPVMPWVWNDYSSAILDLSIVSHYRNLSVPQGGLKSSGDLTREMTSPRIVIDYLYGSQKIEIIQDLWESVDYKELVPEFFYFPEALFADNMVLPPWAQSAFDICYQNRKVLESDMVSQRLHLWIDMVFGVNNTNYAGAGAPLFDKEHPIRERKSAQLHKKIALRFPGGDLLFAEAFDLNEKGFRVMTVDAQSRFCVRQIWTRESDSCSDQIAGVIPGLELRAGIRFCRVNDSIFILDGWHFDGHKLTSMPIVSAPMAVDKDWIVVPLQSSEIQIYRWPCLKAPYRSVAYYREAAVCCCVSERLHSFVIGTLSGGILVYSLECGDSVLAFSVADSVLHSIYLTPSWGFVLALHRAPTELCARMLSLLTINGTRLKAIALTDQPTAIAVWASSDDFDFVAIATQSGSVLVSGAYELNFDRPVFRARVGLGVLALAYNAGTNSIVGVLADRTVFSLPFEAS
jgi:hypothetical protein